MSDEDLLGYLFDALPAEEQEAMEAALERDALARARLDELRRSARLLSEDDVGDEPPLGLAGRTLALVNRHELGAAAATASGRDWSEPRSRMRALDFAVVVSVVGIAALLVLPAIATLRGDQARVVCSEHLRQLGVALTRYADHQQGQAPYVAPAGPLNNAGSFAVALKSSELILDPGTLLCPAASSAMVSVPNLGEVVKALAEPERLDFLRKHMSGSYGYQFGYQDGRVYHGRRMFDLAPLVSDRPPREREVLDFANSPNHGGLGQNVLFSDGGVRWLPAPQWQGDPIFLNDRGNVAAGVGRRDTVIGVSEATPVLAAENPLGL
jgi:hypothetical protein